MQVKEEKAVTTYTLTLDENEMSALGDALGRIPGAYNLYKVLPGEVRKAASERSVAGWLRQTGSL